MKCSRCDHNLAPGRYHCASCGHWQWVSSDPENNDESILFEDITSAEVSRIPTRLIDHCLGGGIVRSDLILLGGPPGCGKSTLVLQIAEVFCAQGECMYVAAEEDVKAIKARGVRLGIDTHRRLRFVPAMGGVANFGELLMRRRPQFIITDSIDALTGRDHEAELAMLDIMKKYAVELQAPFIVTSQVNKDGDYSGLMAKQHAVDVLLTFSTDDESRTESGEALRILETLKNRSGKAFTESFYEMTAKGLVLTLEEPEGDDPEEDAPKETGSKRGKAA